MLLAGDVGGTKALLGLFARAPLRPAPVAVESFPSSE
jgi:glucokinase